MKGSAEVRWFRAGAPPAALDAAFASAVAEPPRTDRYLHFAGAAAVGLKLREGRLEVKARAGGPEAVELAPGVVGAVETWLKWTVDDPGLEAARDAALAAGLPPVPADYALDPDRWIEIAKARRQRKFVVEGDAVREIDPATPLVPGCQVELVRIDASGEPWWSFALETNVRARRRATLACVAAAFVDAAIAIGADPAGLGLGVGDSVGYPEWLGRLSA